jgi:HSP20 family protein
MARTISPLHEMDRFFADMTRTPTSLAMPMDLYREGDTFVAEVDLPGVDPSTIDVDVEDRTLTVRAERAKAYPESDRSWLTHERPTGTYARQLTLGSRVALDRIEAQYSDGVLRLSIPMAEEAKPRKVAVSHVTRGETAASTPEIASETPEA